MTPNNTESSKWPAPLRTLDGSLADVVRESAARWAGAVVGDV